MAMLKKTTFGMSILILFLLGCIDKNENPNKKNEKNHDIEQLDTVAFEDPNNPGSFKLEISNN